MITIDEQIESVEREIKMRARVYPRWVSDGKLSKAKADHETAAMAAVLETLKRVKAQQVPPLFATNGG